MGEKDRVSPKQHIINRALQNEQRCEAIYQAALEQSQKVEETPAEIWKRLIQATVTNTLLLHQSAPDSEDYQLAQDGILTAKDEFRRRFPVDVNDTLSQLRPKLFDDIVDDRIKRYYRRFKQQQSLERR